MMESAFVQQLLVVLVLATAAGWLLRRAWRSVRAAAAPKKASGPGCGCDGCGPGGH
jgi:hypothetical protein